MLKIQLNSKIHIRDLTKIFGKSNVARLSYLVFVRNLLASKIISHLKIEQKVS